MEDVVLTVGGTIPADDIPELKRLGVAANSRRAARPKRSSTSYATRSSARGVRRGPADGRRVTSRTDAVQTRDELPGIGY